MAQPDPFLEVQADVRNTLSATRPLFSSFLRIRTLAPSATSPELHQSRTELLTTLSGLSTDVAELQAAIAAVQQDPGRFGLDVAEVGRRREFVREVSGEVEGMKREVMENNDGAQGSGAGIVGLPDPNSFREGMDGEAEGGGYDDDEFEHQQQQEMMQDQDVELDGVYRTVGNLRVQAEDMGRELEEQGGILGEVDVLADRVGGKLQIGVKRVGHIIKKNEDSVSSCCIAVLIFVLILLLILVIML